MSRQDVTEAVKRHKPNKFCGYVCTESCYDLFIQVDKSKVADLEAMEDAQLLFDSLIKEFLG